jgi:hypothetical protein
LWVSVRSLREPELSGGVIVGVQYHHALIHQSDFDIDVETDWQGDVRLNVSGYEVSTEVILVFSEHSISLSDMPNDSTAKMDFGHGPLGQGLFGGAAQKGGGALMTGLSDLIDLLWRCRGW